MPPGVNPRAHDEVSVCLCDLDSWFGTVKLGGDAHEKFLVDCLMIRGSQQGSSGTFDTGT